MTKDMETLYFITSSGVCGHTEEWDFKSNEYGADGWLQNFGDRIGSGTAKLPSGGWIDLGQFATVKKTQ